MKVGDIEGKHTRRFGLYYYSEVSAVVHVEETSDREGEKIVTTVKHSQYEDSLESSSDIVVDLRTWYWFCDEPWEEAGVTKNEYMEEGKDPKGIPETLSYEVRIEDSKKQAVLQTLHWVAEDLWPGPKFHFEKADYDTDEYYEHFRQDVLFGYLMGESAPAKHDQQATPEQFWIDDFRSENWD